MTKYRSLLIGSGSYLPERILNNWEIAERLDTSHEWIVKRTGIFQRHIAADNELTSDLAVAAAQKALLSANMTADDVDLILVATTTPDETFPATATSSSNSPRHWPWWRST